MFYASVSLTEIVQIQFRSMELAVSSIKAILGGRALRLEKRSVKVMTMHSSKGLEFPLVVLAGLGTINATDIGVVREEARLLYVAMTRSTHELVMTCDRETEITRRLATAAGSLLPQDLQGLYEYATQEIEEARMVPGLWAEAGEQARGAGEQRREIYLAARVNELRGIAEEQLRKESVAR